MRIRNESFYPEFWPGYPSKKRKCDPTDGWHRKPKLKRDILPENSIPLVNYPKTDGSLEELTLNNEGKITDLTGRIISKTYPVGKPQLITINSFGSSFGPAYINFITEFAEAYYPEANAYMTGDKQTILTHVSFAVQFYKIMG